MMFNPFDLSGRTIVVTGASSGIGAQCAIDCSKMGATIVLIGRNEERLQKTVALCDNPSKHLVVPFDLTDYDGLPAMVKNIVTSRGRIDGVVNCAGLSATLPMNAVKKETLNQ